MYEEYLDASATAAELSGRGIHVNRVAPAQLLRRFLAGPDFQRKPLMNLRRRIIAQVSLKRFGQPEEVAGAVTFLASPDASYVTGMEINVDGELAQI